MTGLVKAKKYDWKDSNMALFGSDTDKKVKKDSAKTEPAWAVVGSCNEPNVFVWRIEKFQVKEWPKDDYGRFYDGDSYIVLNVYKEQDQLKYDVHFWIGKRSSQDEYGTAAYKTVELDTYLDDKAIQHREVQGFESEMFRSYFDVLTTMKGGCASGFRHVTPEEYEPRLMHFSGLRKQIVVQEVKLSKNSLTSGDVFILDTGTEAIQWNGKLCNKDERMKAASFLQNLESERRGKTKCETVDEEGLSSSHKFYNNLPDVAVKDKKKKDGGDFPKSLLRLSDESGQLKFSLVAEKSTPKSLIKEEDVYLIDNGKTLFVYVGSGASKEEKQNALGYAHKYLMQTTHPLVPVTVLGAGQSKSNTELDSLLT